MKRQNQRQLLINESTDEEEEEGKNKNFSVFVLGIIK